METEESLNEIVCHATHAKLQIVQIQVLVMEPPHAILHSFGITMETYSVQKVTNFLSKHSNILFKNVNVITVDEFILFRSYIHTFIISQKIRWE